MGDDAERWLQQMRKGSTRFAILQLVHESDRYGYEVVAEIRERTGGALALAEGNVYPALHALEAEGHVHGYWREVETGVPPRKYYRITDQGRTLRQRMLEGWRDHVQAMERLTRIGGGH